MNGGNNFKVITSARCILVDSNEGVTSLKVIQIKLFLKQVLHIDTSKKSRKKSRRGQVKIVGHLL